MFKEDSMAEAYAVTGFVSDKVAKKLKAGKEGTIQVRPERGTTAVTMEVDGAYVAEVRKGSSKSGETLVQLILRDKATVRTVVETRLQGTGVDVFLDPAITRLIAAATVKSIVA
jgi:hypothetical protein